MRSFFAWIYVVIFALTMPVMAETGGKNGYYEFPADTTKTGSLRCTDTAVIKYLALGDSYTIGESVKPDERFPAQVAALLRIAGVKIKDPGYIATSGWTTKNLITAINSGHLRSDYDIVTLLIGVNDQYRGMDTAGYRTRFTSLLAKAIHLAGGRRRRVFVLSIPDYSVTPFVGASYKQTVRSELDSFNAINKQVAFKYKVAYVDITPFSREAATDPSLIARDGLHFSGLQYKKWSAKLEPVMIRALGY